MDRPLQFSDNEFHQTPESLTTNNPGIEDKATVSLGERLTSHTKLVLLVGALGLNMAIGGHMKAARHSLTQSGNLNSKDKMPSEQKKLRRRKRRKK